MKRFLLMAALSIQVLGGATARGQGALKLPEASPEATVSQMIGLTQVTVVYHRPAVAGRAIWGKLVPYGEPWRAGANENTTIAFSSDVKIGGKPLKAGTYGLHMLPGPKDWTVMFSTVSVAWGSFSYNPKEDALRVTVAPKPIANVEERLSYRFDDPSDRKATLVLSWEKLAVPIAIDVETPAIVTASIDEQLRGVHGFSWQGYAQAASYALKRGAPEEALAQLDHLAGLMNMRAALLAKLGAAPAATELRAKVPTIASAADLADAGHRLLSDHKPDAAVRLFRAAADRFPESAIVQDGLGDALTAKGDKAGAIAAYTKASALAKDPAQKTRIEATVARLKAP